MKGVISQYHRDRFSVNRLFIILTITPNHIILKDSRQLHCHCVPIPSVVKGKQFRISSSLEAPLAKTERNYNNEDAKVITVLGQ